MDRFCFALFDIFMLLLVVLCRYVDDEKVLRTVIDLDIKYLLLVNRVGSAAVVAERRNDESALIYEATTPNQRGTKLSREIGMYS